MLVHRLKYETIDNNDLIPDSEWDGHFNHMPKPFWEITRDEYLHRTGGYTPEYTWYQQVTDIPGEKTMLSLTFERYGANVYAVSSPNGWRCATKAEQEEGKYGIVFTEEPRYFRVGCNHEYSSQTIGNCLNRLTCSKCGHSYTVDSSD